MDDANRPEIPQNVIPLNSAICKIDSAAGALSYRGYDVADLASECCFEEVAHLLWHERLPNSVELREITHDLAAHRALTLPTFEFLTRVPHHALPMAVLRSAISAVGLHDPRADSDLATANIELAYRLTALAATIVATFHRLRYGDEPPLTDPGLSHAANFLYCLTGEYPDDLAIRAFDSCLTLHAEHGLNPSAFAARVTAATLSDMYSAVIAAIGALRGPLHGGANQQVIGMLEEIGGPANARAWIHSRLAANKRVPGFGHPIYEGVDPRAAALAEWRQKLGDHTGQPQWYDISRAVEEVMLHEQGLHPNVDFHSASVYSMLGIDADLYICVFAMARMVGWTAHIMEQWAHNQPIRPRANYTGPTGLTLPPLEER
jgi:citrate synthase